MSIIDRLKVSSGVVTVPEIGKSSDATSPAGSSHLPAGLPLVSTVAERQAAATAERRRQDELDIAAKIASLTPASRILFHQRVAGRRAAGEPEPGVEWRALVDVRIECGHWK